MRFPRWRALIEFHPQKLVICPTLSCAQHMNIVTQVVLTLPHQDITNAVPLSIAWVLPSKFVDFLFREVGTQDGQTVHGTK